MKKLIALLIITTMVFATTGCEMDENTIGMLMSFMSGLSGGYSGGGFNTAGGSGGDQWAQMGGQLSNMWMSQSENNQQGRDMSSLLQVNQMALDYSVQSGQSPSQNSSQSSNNSGGSTNDGKTTEQKATWGSKITDKLSNLDAKDWEKVGNFATKYINKGDSR